MSHVEAEARRDAEGSYPAPPPPFPPSRLPPLSTHTLALWAVGETETEFTFWSCGWFYCLPNCVRHINIYCLFPLWNKVAFLAPFSPYLSLHFSPCPVIPPCVKLWPRDRVQENRLECGMRYLWNWHLNLEEKKKNLLLFTLYPCWKYFAVLLSSLLLMLY